MSRFRYIASREQIVEENRLVLIWRDVREAAAKPRLVIDGSASMREVLIANMATALKDVLAIDATVEVGR